MEIKYAGFWRRLAAGLVDGLVFLPNVFILPRLEGVSVPAAIFAFLFGQTCYYVYTLLLTHRYGGTLGKLALGIRVRPVDGGELTWRHVLRRSAVDMVISVMMIFTMIIGVTRVEFSAFAAADSIARSQMINNVVPWWAALNFTYMGWLASEFVVIMLNRRRRALHDFIAGTVVIVVRRSTTKLDAPVGQPV